jgi:hypothetical protein
MELKGILVPIALFLCAAYCFKALIDAAMSYRLVRMGNSPEIVSAVFQSLAAHRRMESLRWGLVLVALGGGFALIQQLGWREVNPGAIAILLAGTGLAQLCFFGLSRKLT